MRRTAIALLAVGLSTTAHTQTASRLSQIGMLGEWSRSCPDDDVRQQFVTSPSGYAYSRQFERSSGRTLRELRILEVTIPDATTIRLKIEGENNSFGLVTYHVIDGTLRLMDVRDSEGKIFVQNGKMPSGVEQPQLVRCDGGRIGKIVAAGQTSPGDNPGPRPAPVSSERQKECAAEWKQISEAGSVPEGMKWPAFWAECSKRVKATAAGQKKNAAQRAEAQRIEAAKRKQAVRSEFTQKYAVAQLVNEQTLVTNPFVFKDKIVGVHTAFGRMITENEALFYWDGVGTQALLVSGVPSLQFSSQVPVVLAMKVFGTKAVNLPTGEVTLPFGEFVGVLTCASKNCTEFYDQ